MLQKVDKRAKTFVGDCSLFQALGRKRAGHYIFTFFILCLVKVNHFPTTNQSRIPSLPFVDFDTLKMIQDP